MSFASTCGRYAWERPVGVLFGGMGRPEIYEESLMAGSGVGGAIGLG